MRIVLLSLLLSTTAAAAAGGAPALREFSGFRLGASRDAFEKRLAALAPVETNAGDIVVKVNGRDRWRVPEGSKKIRCIAGFGATVSCAFPDATDAPLAALVAEIGNHENGVEGILADPKGEYVLAYTFFFREDLGVRAYDGVLGKVGAWKPDAPKAEAASKEHLDRLKRMDGYVTGRCGKDDCAVLTWRWPGKRPVTAHLLYRTLRSGSRDAIAFSMADEAALDEERRRLDGNAERRAARQAKALGF